MCAFSGTQCEERRQILHFGFPLCHTYLKLLSSRYWHGNCSRRFMEKGREAVNAHLIGSGQASAAIIEELSRRIGERFPNHPFRNAVNKDNFERVIAEYLAMSIAFPFIQAGAIHETYKAALRAGGDTDKNAEITGAIGAYLVWDEVGGHKLTLERGNDVSSSFPRPAGTTTRTGCARIFVPSLARTPATSKCSDHTLSRRATRRTLGCAQEPQRRLHDRVRMPCTEDDQRLVGHGMRVLCSAT